MKDYMISMFIDDEMSVDEKIEFVETVHTDAAAKDETIDLLRQEKLIRARVVDRIREAEVNIRPRLSLRFWKPAAAFACGLAAALLVVFFSLPGPKMATAVVLARPSCSGLCWTILMAWCAKPWNSH